MHSGKTVYESLTEQVHIIMPEHINGSKRLFGGRLMEWIDVVAAVVARRHSNSEVTTACVDNLQFKAGAVVNDTIVIKGRITWVGNTSMEVRCDTFAEAVDGKQEMINRAYLVLVAVDENGKPKKVPSLILKSEEDNAEWALGTLRQKMRHERRNNEF